MLGRFHLELLCNSLTTWDERFLRLREEGARPSSAFRVRAWPTALKGWRVQGEVRRRQRKGGASEW
eukprot:1474624-Pleurochrysis_carterae.AAC.2